MFTIIGGDGKEYGPVTAEQIQQWLAAGRASLETRAKKEGEEAWRRIGDFPEFGAGAPPPLVGSGSVGNTSLASQGARTGAALLNAFLYACCLLPGGTALSMKVVAQGVHSPEQLDPSLAAGPLRVMELGLFAAIAVQVCLLAVRGQNLGMLVTRIRVVRVSGEPADFVHAALLRFLLPIAPLFLPYGIGFLGLLLLCVDYVMMFRADRRCLHDLIADTKVVKA
ncbi:MAG TPA: RDD family protein [Opitutaceae bacterium]|nr:RDD family protein [Opitutaceae bacterium]